MINLFEPAALHTLTLQNRFIRSATWTGTADETGHASEETILRMEQSAAGGVGLIITGHAYVQPAGQASPRQLGIFGDQFIDGLKHMTDRVHAKGGKIVLQLAHAGMYAMDTAPLPHLVVSKIEDKPDTEQRTFTPSDIQILIEDFISAGRRAAAAGFDGVMPHAAHGYLLSQFLSPYYNKRTDAFGGDIRGRAAVPCAILRGLRAALGADFPILVKMNGRDFIEGGLTAEDAAQTAHLLEEAGCNALELSGGLARNIKYSPSRMGISNEKKEAYFLEDARIVKQQISIPLILVGGIRSLAVAQNAVDTGAADFIALSRPLICEPNLIARWQSGDTRPSLCKSDNRCFKPGLEGRGIACAHPPTHSI